MSGFSEPASATVCGLRCPRCQTFIWIAWGNVIPARCYACELLWTGAKDEGPTLESHRIDCGRAREERCRPGCPCVCHNTAS
jgi:hypothetical protein